MNREKIAELYKEYGLEKEDVFKHQHYLILRRSGIEKIQAKAKVEITYNVERCEPNFAVVKAYAKMENVSVETFGSALKGTNFQDGNTNSWYVIEMAEKRAMSRAVLKITGFYEHGCFGEDEAEEFKQSKNK